MANPTTEPAEETTAPELGDLIRVVFAGNATPSDQTDLIKLQPGPRGEDRTLARGGSPQDALVTHAELNMLGGKFSIEICEEQPKLTDEEVQAQTPEPISTGGEGATLPHENPDAEASPDEIEATPPALQPEPEEGGEQKPSAGEQPAQPAAQPAQPSGQTPTTPAVPSPPQPPQQGQPQQAAPTQTPPADAPGQSSPTTGP
jgi:hypothetical protein